MKHLYLSILLALFLPAHMQAQSCPAPFAMAKYTIGTDGFTVSFQAESCDPDIKYRWDFGDGASTTYAENNREPVHVYTSDGTYIAKLYVQNACGQVFTKDMVIVIRGGSPGALWATLSGPTIAAECQEVIYTANVIGGVPPYTYTWDISDYYCNQCVLNQCNGAGTAQTLTGGPSKKMYFASNPSGNAHLILTLTVKDARGTTEVKVLNVNVKGDVDIEIRAIAEKASCGTWGINQDILFYPEIQPSRMVFDYPTDYIWDFDDGKREEDRHDGGGVVLHKFTSAGEYTVKVDVCDPNGCMQATKKINICDPNGGGGGGTNNCKLVNENQNLETVILDYDQYSSFPSFANFRVVNLNGNCLLPVTKWTGRIVEDDGAMFINNVPINGTEIGLDLLDPYWQNKNPRPWGCISMTATVTSGGGACENCSGSTPGMTKNCIAFIQPDELEIMDFIIEGSCRDYTIQVVVSGGGWKKNGNKYEYKEYDWKTYDSNNHESEITGLLIDIPGDATKKKINIEHPYFTQYGPNSWPEFMLKLTVADFANQSDETFQPIFIDPFRVHVKDEYTRCPGVTSKLSNDPLATGGTGGPYTFVWSNPTLQGDNPDFTSFAAPNVTQTFAVTVTDGPGCSLTKSFSIKTTVLNSEFLQPISFSCADANMKIKIGPNDLNLGGSGSYSYSWSPTEYLSDAEVSNPEVSGIPVGLTKTYTLVLTDIFGGCSQTDAIDVTSFANDLSINASTPVFICYGDGTKELRAQGAPAPSGWNALPYRYTWTTNHRNHVGIEDEHNNTLSIPEMAAKYSGNYVYTVRYSNLFTGCYVEKDINVTIRDQWTHKGYVPEVKSTVIGQQVDLWKAGTNTITSLIPNNNNITVIWTPFAPISTTTNNNSGLLPQNGKFVPTTANNQLTMKVVDNATGCSKEYKSQRYILSYKKPEIFINPHNFDICEGNKLCLDIKFDTHLGNYVTSLLPDYVMVKVNVAFDQQVSANKEVQFVKLKLINSSGLYAGEMCTKKNMIREVPNSMVPLNTQVELQSSVWENTQDFIQCYIHGSNSHKNISTCFGNAPNEINGYEIKFGINCSPPGISIRNRPFHEFRAGSFINIQVPNKGTTLIYATDPHPSTNIGPSLAISPCISELVEMAPELTLRENEEIVAESKMNLTEPVIESIGFEVLPNPFSQTARITYTIPQHCHGDIEINIRDFTGRLIKVIEKHSQVTPGIYRTIYDGSTLPPGLYLYELLVCNNKRVVKKIEKINH